VVGALLGIGVAVVAVLVVAALAFVSIRWTGQPTRGGTKGNAHRERRMCAKTHDQQTPPPESSRGE